MNFEKLLKAKAPAKKQPEQWDPIADIIYNAAINNRSVLVNFNPEYAMMVPVARLVNQKGNVSKTISGSYAIAFADFTFVASLQGWSKIIESVKTIE